MSFLGNTGRGMMMGLAGLFPSVSAGTIALILGIHARLIAAVASLNLKTPKVLWQAARGDADARTAALRFDLVFLAALVLGMGIAIFGGVAGVDWLLQNWPGVMMALFFGLMSAGAFVPWSRIENPMLGEWLWALAGASIAAGAAFLPTLTTIGGVIGYVLAGFIAWTFMLLPGVSGSSMMVALGLYEPLIAAARGLDLGPLLAFAVGGVFGLAICSRGLQWLLLHHPGRTFAALAGLIVGSLVRVWPWRSEPGFAAGQPALPSWDGEVMVWLSAAVLGVILVRAMDKLGPPAEEAEQAPENNG